MAQKKTSPKHRPEDDWLRIADLLLSIQGEFQQVVYDTIDPFPRLIQQEVLNGVHHLFARYYASAVEGPQGSASPQDVVDAAIEELSIQTPEDARINLRLYRSPERSRNPHRQIRMRMGLEYIAQFPLVADLTTNRRGKPLYFADPAYCQCLVTLGKHAVGGIKPAVILRGLWEYVGTNWWSNNPVFAQVYTLVEFENMLRIALESSTEDWGSTDELFDEIFQRTEGAGLAMDHPKKVMAMPRGTFEEPKDEEEFLQDMALFHLGNQLCSEWLFPLATYLPLLEYHYLEPFPMVEDLHEFAAASRKRPVSLSSWVSKPPSYFRIRKGIATTLWQEAFR